MKAASAANQGRGARSVIAALALAVVAIVGLPVPRGQAAEPCEPALARIVSVQGRVEVQRGGAGAWAAAAQGDPLCIGDTIRVGSLAQAALALANDSVLSVDQDTTLRLGGEPETGRSLLDLLFGDVHFFSHRPRALEIETPIVNAATEGTEFLMRARPDRTEVVMFEGRVRLVNAEGELLLASGEAGVATAGAAPERELVARPRDAVAWALYYPPIHSRLAGAPGALPEGVGAAASAVAANDYAGAIAALDAVPEPRRDGRYYAYRAGVLLNVGRVDQAAEAIERALALNPDAAEALAERAVIAVVQNRRADALADARRAVELAPASAPARIALSYALQANFELEAAREVLREAAARTPDDALVQARLAELELSFGDLDAAEIAAARAVALAPDLARTQMVLGFAALTRIEVDRAKAAFERAIALDSAEPLARLGLGLAKIRAGDLEDGRRELEIAAALDPNNSLLRSYLGKAYFEERRGPQDADQFQIAKELDPNDPTPYFYDAIRKQSENRPVEALRDLETSIALNDNRAVFRSRLLLDEDRATRGVSLARIYDDLGFDRVALVEASKSLSQDPANHSAHRFLSDTYARLPRHEIARASELLQSQLLQPVNLNPVQPSLAVTDLNVAPALGPGGAGFNEFHPLFTRNGAEVTATGVAGNEDTLGGESVISMVSDQYALSVGGFISTTDGYRDNNDLKNKLADGYAQWAVTPDLDLQVEYRWRDTDQGDLRLNFDPDDFSDDDRRDVDQETARFGARYAPSPNSDVLLSLLYSDRNEDLTESNIPFPGILDRLDSATDDNAYQAEGQYLYRGANFNTTVGGGAAYVDVDQTRNRTVNAGGVIVPFPEEEQNFERKQGNAYVYNNINIPSDLTWTVGLGFDTYDEESIDFNALTPKLGLQWQVSDAVRVRAAAMRTVKRALVVQQTLEPTEVAGFNQFFDDFNGTTADRYGVGLDFRVSRDVYTGVEVSHRDLELRTKILEGESATKVAKTDQDEQLYRLYASWTPGTSWSLNAEVSYEKFDSDETPNQDIPRDVRTLMVPLSLRYFSPSGWFAEIGPTFVHQEVERQSASTLPEGDDSFMPVDAAIGWRLPKRHGLVSLEARNLFDQGFKFQDDNYRTSEIRGPMFFPDRTILGRLIVTF